MFLGYEEIALCIVRRSLGEGDGSESNRVTFTDTKNEVLAPAGDTYSCAFSNFSEIDESQK